MALHLTIALNLASGIFCQCEAKFQRPGSYASSQLASERPAGPPTNENHVSRVPFAPAVPSLRPWETAIGRARREQQQQRLLLVIGVILGWFNQVEAIPEPADAPARPLCGSW